MKRENVSLRIRSKWVYLPGVMLFLLGLAILLFPDAMRWVLAGFIMASGLLMMYAIRTLRNIARTVRSRVSDVYLERMEEESSQALSDRGTVYVSHIN